jgi:sulfite exporter TauE/SafE
LDAGSAILTGLGLGLASGSTCFWSCATVLGPYLVATEREPAGRWSTVPSALRSLLWYHLGRLLAYLGIGLLAGCGAGRARLPPAIQAAALFLTALLLGISLLRPSNRERCWGARRRAQGAFAMGLLQGLLPCPTFLSALAVALASPGLAGALLLFAFLFLGTSVFSLPLALLEPLRRRPLLRRLTLAGGGLVCLLIIARAAALLRDGAAG